MPKVSNFRIKIKGEYKVFDIYYSKNGGFYTKNFPDEIHTLSNTFRQQPFETERELVSFYNKITDEFHEKIKKQRKVIVYRISAPTGKIMNRISEGGWSGNQAWIPSNIKNKLKTTNEEGFGFIISYNVWIRIDGEETTYHCIKDNGETGSRRHLTDYDIEIDWSPERENFFRNIEKAADEMLRKLILFFGQDEVNLLKAFDSGQKLLVG